MNTKSHWDTVYISKADTDVSWTQSDPKISLSLISEICPRGSVVDIGAGASPLAGRLLDAGYDVAVLDIAAAALDRARGRLGEAAKEVRWIVANVTAVDDIGHYDVWHDRAVFHFLTELADRKRYVGLLQRTIPPGGHAVIATFAMDGPAKCSGLDVRRYDGPSLALELGSGFALVKTVAEIHLTPWGKPQSFQYSVFHCL